MQTLSHESQKEPLDPDYQGTSHSITRSTYLLPDGTGAIDCLRKVENTRVDQKTVEDLTWYNPLETESEYTVKQAMSAEGSIEYQPSSVLQDFAADQSIDMSTFVAMIKSKGAQVGRDNLSRQFSEYAWSQYASQLSADGSERSGVINEFLIYSHLFALNQGFAKHYLPEVLELYFTSIPGAGKEGSYTPSLSLKELKNAHRLQ
jgi:hypothetical protein